MAASNQEVRENIRKGGILLPTVLELDSCLGMARLGQAYPPNLHRTAVMKVLGSEQHFGYYRQPPGRSDISELIHSRSRTWCSFSLA